ncbi:MAG: hypothetical protein ACN6ON_08945 [Sphingobacterium sp.]
MRAFTFLFVTDIVLWQLLAVLEFMLKIYSLYVLFKRRGGYRPFLLPSFLMILCPVIWQSDFPVHK